MSRDEEVYENPDQFKPERFLSLSPTEAAEVDPKNYIFGFGRRCVVFNHTPPCLRVECVHISRCPGEFFADTGVWLAISSIVSAFDIRAPMSEAGEPIFPPEEYVPGFVR